MGIILVTIGYLRTGKENINNGNSIVFEYIYPSTLYDKAMVRFEKTMLYNFRGIFKNHSQDIIFIYKKWKDYKGARYDKFAKLYEIK